MERTSNLQPRTLENSTSGWVNGLIGVRDCLDRGQGEITLDEGIRARAQGCIQRMLDFTAVQAARTPATGGFVPKIGAA